MGAVRDLATDYDFLHAYEYVWGAGRQSPHSMDVPMIREREMRNVGTMRISPLRRGSSEGFTTALIHSQ